MLYVSFGDEGAIDELTLPGSSGEDSAALEPRDDRSDRRLGQLPLGVQLLPDLGDRQLALLPKQAKDGDLELSELLAIRHLTSSPVSTRVDSTRVERHVKRKFSEAHLQLVEQQEGLACAQYRIGRLNPHGRQRPILLARHRHSISHHA